MKVYCGLCGHEAHQLFSHLRETHEMAPEKYLERCPEAPLISDELAKFLKNEHVITTGDGLKKKKELFDITLTSDILPTEHVPEVEEDYLLQEDLSHKICISLKEAEKIMLVGPTGLGKSTLIEQLAAKLNWPLIRVAASGGLTESDFLGEWTVRNGETVFNYGFLPRAMRKGAICLIDEIDGIEPSVAFSIHQLMEEQGKLVLLQNGGEVIEPHENFRLVATANTLGHGDEAGLYTGTRVLNEAFLDRFAAVFRMNYMSPGQEAEIIKSKVPELKNGFAHSFAKVASEIRDAIEQEELYCTFSTRRLINLARKYCQLDSLNDALELTVLNKLAESDRSVIKEIFQRYLGNHMEE